MAQQFVTPGLEARLKHLDFSFNQERQVMQQKWDTKMNELKAKLQVEVARNRIDRNQAQQIAGQFVQARNTAASEFFSKYRVEQDRIKTFYQPAEQEQDVMDPVRQYKTLLSERSEYESVLSEFTERPGGTVSKPINIAYLPDLKKGKVPFVAGGLQVKEYQYVPDGKGGQKKVMKLRDASREEMTRWAVAQAGMEEVNRLLSQVRTNRHVAARDKGNAFDPTNGGTFDQKIRDTMPNQPKEEPAISDDELASMSLEELKAMRSKLLGG